MVPRGYKLLLKEKQIERSGRPQTLVKGKHGKGGRRTSKRISRAHFSLIAYMRLPRRRMQQFSSLGYRVPSKGGKM